jgi:hypothetical protein
MSNESEDLLRVRVAYRTLYAHNQRLLGLARDVALSLDGFGWSGMYVPYDEESVVTESWSPDNRECCLLSATPMLAACFMFYNNQCGNDGSQHVAGDELLSLQFTADDQLNNIVETEGGGAREEGPISSSVLASSTATAKAYARVSLARCMTSCAGKTWFKVWDKIEFAGQEFAVSHWPVGKQRRYSLVYQNLPEQVAFCSTSLLPAIREFIANARPILERS